MQKRLNKRNLSRYIGKYVRINNKDGEVHLGRIESIVGSEVYLRPVMKYREIVFSEGSANWAWIDEKNSDMVNRGQISSVHSSNRQEIDEEIRQVRAPKSMLEILNQRKENPNAQSVQIVYEVAED